MQSEKKNSSVPDRVIETSTLSEQQSTTGTKVPYEVYLMKNQGKMAIFLESILFLLTKKISLMHLVTIP